MHYRGLMGTFILILAFVLSTSVVSASGEESAQVSLSHTTVHQGQNVNVEVIFESINDLAALTMEVYYDENNLKVSGYSVAPPLSSTFLEVDFSQPGRVLISLLDVEGLSLEGKALDLNFSSNEDAEFKLYPLHLAVGEAYDVSLNALTVKSSNGSIGVTERPVSPNSISFSQSLNKIEAVQGDHIVWTIQSSQLRGLSAGSFEVVYDANILTLKETVLGDSLTSDASLSVENTTGLGIYQLSIINLNGLNVANPFLILKFEVVSEKMSSTDLRFYPQDLYNTDLQPLISTELKRTIDIKQKTILPSQPTIELSDIETTEEKVFEVFFKLPEDANLAAGTFKLSYNPFLMDLVEIQALEHLSSSNGLFIYTENDEGVIEFSIISAENLDAGDLLSFKFKTKLLDQSLKTSLELSMISAYDEQLNALSLNVKSNQVQITKMRNVSFYDASGVLIKAVSLPYEDPLPDIVPPNISGRRFYQWQETTLDNTHHFHAEYVLPGDVNDDGVISILDIALIQLHLAESITLTDKQIFAGHVSSSNNLSLQDVMTLQLYLVGLRDLPSFED